MPKDTKIGWTEATWNPFSGCVKVSPGCNNCYAETLTEQRRGTNALPLASPTSTSKGTLSGLVRIGYWRGEYGINTRTG